MTTRGSIKTYSSQLMHSYHHLPFPVPEIKYEFCQNRSCHRPFKRKFYGHFIFDDERVQKYIFQPILAFLPTHAISGAKENFKEMQKFNNKGDRKLISFHLIINDVGDIYISSGGYNSNQITDYPTSMFKIFFKFVLSIYHISLIINQHLLKNPNAWSFLHLSPT